MSKKGEETDLIKKERATKNEAKEEVRSPLPTKDSFENE